MGSYTFTVFQCKLAHTVGETAMGLLFSQVRNLVRSHFWLVYWCYNFIL